MTDAQFAPFVGLDSVVGIATRCRLDCPGIESRWGLDFPHPFRPTLGPHAYRVSLRGVKRPGRGVGRTAPPGAEVTGRLELYSTPPLGLHGLF